MNAHVTIALPPKLVPLFAPPRGDLLYRTARGGRGSGKSRNFAKMAAIWGYIEGMMGNSFRVLCVREFQNSIKESFHAELKAAIESEKWLSDFYDVGESYLRSKNGLVEFLFRGLHGKEATIKSLANIDLTIVEEAENITAKAWRALRATVFRRPKSEMWVVWNPESPESPVDKIFVKEPPARSINIVLNWQDNPFFPPEMNELRLDDLERLDQNTYDHIWGGEYLINSDRQIFNGKWTVRDFVIGDDWNGPYQGGDFGFSQDPLAMVRCYIHEDTLYISHEAGGLKIDLDKIGETADRNIPAFSAYKSRWDSASPGSISHIAKPERTVPLLLAEGAEKWPGSVEDGIAFIRAFKKVVIHTRCVETAREFKLYSFKVDRLTGDVLADIVDAWNHYIDAIRYALSPMIKNPEPVGILLSRKRK